VNPTKNREKVTEKSSARKFKIFLYSSPGGPEKRSQAVGRPGLKQFKGFYIIYILNQRRLKENKRFWRKAGVAEWRL
jgi:hypothetical protein